MSTELTTMTDDELLRARITASQHVRVTPTRANLSPQQPVHAINWFDTRSLWLYNFYNAIAAGSVSKVGGVPLFKGRLQEILHGDECSSRQTLLLVSYPDARHFTRLLGNRYFQLTSVVRELAVKQFTFGLSAASQVDFSKWGQSDESTYLLIHWRCNEQETKDFTEAAATVTTNSEIDTVFSASINYTLTIEKKGTPSSRVPCLMDHCIVLRHQSPDVLREHFVSQAQALLQPQASSLFAALLQRIS